MGFKKASTGRNDPCPCGSGIKYKKCCLNKDDDRSGGALHTASPSPAHRPNGATAGQVSASAVGGFKPVSGRQDLPGTGLDAALAGKKFKTMEQAQAFAEQYMQQRNTLPVPEFHGLSPEQMHRIIHSPLDSPSLITLAEDFQVNPDVPFVMFFEKLLLALASKTFKPTTKGNLPRAFTRQTALQYWGEEKYKEKTRHGNINSEEGFRPLNAFRHTCEFAGCLRKYKGNFIISSKCQKLLKAGGLSAVYRELFQTFNREFNWAAYDGYTDIPHLQHSWVFSLHLLQQYGSQWRPSDFYEDAILAAFPALIHEAYPHAYTSAEEVVKGAYRRRVISQWMKWFGLAELKENKTNDFWDTSLQVRKTALADQIMTIHL